MKKIAQPSDPVKAILPLPPTTNHAYGAVYKPSLRRAVFYLTKEATTWKKQAARLLSKPGRRLLEGEVEVFVHWYLKYDRDVDGGLKIVLDALKGTVIKDDRTVVALHSFKRKDAMPRCEVEVYEV